MRNGEEGVSRDKWRRLRVMKRRRKKGATYMRRWSGTISIIDIRLMIIEMNEWSRETLPSHTA